MMSDQRWLLPQVACAPQSVPVDSLSDWTDLDPEQSELLLTVLLLHNLAREFVEMMHVVIPAAPVAAVLVLLTLQIVDGYEVVGPAPIAAVVACSAYHAA